MVSSKHTHTQVRTQNLLVPRPWIERAGGDRDVESKRVYTDVHPPVSRH